MPPYNENIVDTIYLMFMILFGTILFSKFTGGIQVVFAKDHQEVTLKDQIMNIEEGLQGYFISHNDMKNVKLFTF